MENLELNKDIKELTDFLDKHDVDYKVIENRVVAEDVVLYLQDNDLTQLPDSIGYLQCESLYLNDNPLTLESLKSLKKMKDNGFNVIY